jgi:hypothetical protein
MERNMTNPNEEIPAILRQILGVLEEIRDQGRVDPEITLSLIRKGIAREGFPGEVLINGIPPYGSASNDSGYPQEHIGGDWSPFYGLPAPAIDNGRPDE